MATTATKLFPETPVGGLHMQIWNFSIGASDTTATWSTGLKNVIYFAPITNSAEINGQPARNSNDGTEGSVFGDVYIASLANSTTGYALVIGN